MLNYDRIEKNWKYIFPKLNFFYLFGWFVIAWLNVYADMYFTSFQNLTFGSYLHHFMLFRFPFQLPFIAFCFLKLKPKKWMEIFYWKVWLIPCVSIIAVSFYNWQLNPEYATTTILGYSWTWFALLEWVSLFIMQHYLYAHRRIDAFQSFLLSYLGIFVGTYLHEVPWIISRSPSIWSYIELSTIVGMGLLIYLLHYNKIKLDWLIILPFIFLFICWFFYWPINLYAPWLNRLLVYPLFLYLPFRTHS